MWNIKDGQCLNTLAGKERHQSAVTSLQFLESGMVVTSSDDGTVKLWDAVQGSLYFFILYSYILIIDEHRNSKLLYLWPNR